MLGASCLELSGYAGNSQPLRKNRCTLSGSRKYLAYLLPEVRKFTLVAGDPYKALTQILLDLTASAISVAYLTVMLFMFDRICLPECADVFAGGRGAVLHIPSKGDSPEVR